MAVHVITITSCITSSEILDVVYKKVYLLSDLHIALILNIVQLFWWLGEYLFQLEVLIVRSNSWVESNITDQLANGQLCMQHTAGHLIEIRLAETISEGRRLYDTDSVQPPKYQKFLWQLLSYCSLRILRHQKSTQKSLFMVTLRVAQYNFISSE